MSLFSPRWLFRDGLLPEQTFFVGFARSDLTVDAIRAACMPYLKVNLDQGNFSEGWWREFVADRHTNAKYDKNVKHIPMMNFSNVCQQKCKHYCCLTQVMDTEAERLSTFFSRNTYVSGKYGDETTFSRLDTHIKTLPGGSDANRLFYLALPPTVYHDVTKNIKHCCMSTKSVYTLILPSCSVTPFTRLSIVLFWMTACEEVEL